MAAVVGVRDSGGGGCDRCKAQKMDLTHRLATTVIRFGEFRIQDYGVLTWLVCF